jgi:hypothetical protein
MAMFNSKLLVYQRVNLHFPMVFLWFSHGFPMVFLSVPKKKHPGGSPDPAPTLTTGTTAPPESAVGFGWRVAETFDDSMDWFKGQ